MRSCFLLTILKNILFANQFPHAFPHATLAADGVTTPNRPETVTDYVRNLQRPNCGRSVNDRHSRQQPGTYRKVTKSEARRESDTFKFRGAHSDNGDTVRMLIVASPHDSPSRKLTMFGGVTYSCRQRWNDSQKTKKIGR